SENDPGRDSGKCAPLPPLFAKPRTIRRTPRRRAIQNQPLPPTVEPSARLRIADLLSKGVFGLLLLLIVATAIPYGTIEPWWKAAFVCGVFAIFILAVIENLLNPSNRIPGAGVLLPMLAFTVLALIQTINLRP